jgi:hypothetical protein
LQAINDVYPPAQAVELVINLGICSHFSLYSIYKVILIFIH